MKVEPPRGWEEVYAKLAVLEAEIEKLREKLTFWRVVALYAALVVVASMVWWFRT